MFIMAKDQEKTIKRERKPSLVLAAVLLLIIFGAATGVLSLALGTGGLGPGLVGSYFTDTRLLLFNLAPVVLLHLAVYMIVGRPWLAFLLSSGGVLFFSFLESLKLKQTSEPIWFSDIVSGEAFDYISDASKVRLDLLSILCVIYLIAVTTLLLVLFLKRKSPWFAGRIIFLAILAGASVWGFMQVTDTSKYPVEPHYDGTIELGEDARHYVTRGFVYPLMLTVGRGSAETAPGGYSAEDAAEMLKAFEASDITEDKAVSIVAIQLESFADYTDISDVASAYEDYDRIRASSLTGTLVTGGYKDASAGPARTFLTGYVSPGTIRTYTNSYVHYLRSQGYGTQGVQPVAPGSRNTERTCDYLGFGSFSFPAYTEGPGGADTGGNTDWMLYSKVYDMWREGLSKGNARQFIFAASTQNSAPYDSETSHYGIIINEDIPAAQRNVLNNYFGAIKDSFFYLGTMLDRMEADEEPVVVVIYSKCAPDLGGALDVFTRTAVVRAADTRYIIWANSAAKAKLGVEFSGTGRTLSTAFLVPELFRLCGLGGPSFMKASQALSEDVPVILEDGRCMISGASWFAGELPLELQSRVYNHNYIEFYEKTNFRYGR